MARHQEPGVFDVSKPHKTQPSSTSRPVIVGHQPQVSDPMVKEKTEKSSTDAKTIPVAFHGDDQPGTHSMITKVPETTGGTAASDAEETTHEEEFEHQHDLDMLGHAQTKKEIEPVNPNIKPEPLKTPTDEPKSTVITPVDTSLEDEKTEPSFGGPVAAQTQSATAAVMTEPLHIPRGSGVSGLIGKPLKWALIGIVLLAALIYLAIDSGLVKSNINLPFHIFNKQKKDVVSQPNPSPAPVVAPVVPPTTANYTVSGTGVRYTYPLSWGTPTTSTELGYATRGGGAKPTGAYAYLTTFDKNKDIQIAITSSRYLPPARTPLFYDHLQWCVGTSDSKIYSSVLLFNTANGIDTPTTVVCNNGPLADATKLNATTIIQFKTKSPDGKTILGDVYTKNLTGPANLPVLRVKDAAMTNTDEIKQLLSSIKVSSDAQ